MRVTFVISIFEICFEQAVSKPPLILLWIDRFRPRPPTLTDSSGRGQRRQRHGGVFVRFCGTGRCGECVIEVPQLLFVPLFGAGVHGAEEQPEQVILHLLIFSGCMDGVSVWLALH